MKWLHLFSALAVASQTATLLAAAEPDGIQSKTTAPVLRPTEPADNVVLRLPGAPAPKRPVVAAPAPAVTPSVAVPEPAPTTMPAVAEKPAALTRPVETATRFEPPKPLIAPEPSSLANKITSPSKPAPPPEFQKDSARFCQGKIGQWKEADARALLGASRRQRVAYDDNKAANGRIYAFSDPTGRYREIELDFDKAGKLRTVYGYPPKLTWKECQKLWGAKFASADAKEGRTFYSYLNRRLDVLVDQNGNVISLGLY